MKKFLKVIIIMCLFIINAFSTRAQQSNKQKFVGYLFAYFTGNKREEEAIHFAISQDGYRFRALNGDKPVMASATISETGGTRDPHILRGEDGKSFYMVATDMVSDKGWNSNRGFVMLKSQDLIHWKSTIINIQKMCKDQEDLQRVWAPQTIYDKEKGKYMIYFSMQNGSQEDILYYVYANKTFDGFEGQPKQLFFPKDHKACIDPDIIEKNNKFYLFYKTENADKGVHLAIADNVNEGYVSVGGALQSCPDQVEGSSVFKLNNGKGYIFMYDRYTTGKFQFTFTKDFKHFEIVDSKVSLDFQPRHGSVISITDSEAQRLEAQWLTAKDIVTHPQSTYVSYRNTCFDSVKRSVNIPVSDGVNTHRLNPLFYYYPFVKYSPSQTQDFSKGPVPYKFNIGGKFETINVNIVHYNNPVLKGYYADPEILYSNKTKQYYLYPTSDGFKGWSGSYFKTFSSSDLVHWKDAGVILQLGKDVKWADRKAWAPCIVEKKIKGQYKYYFYFAAAGKIGVAVSDNPTGPFVDKGLPLISQFPKRIKDGQQIDPDVFTDPVTNKSYLYWGNGYMAGAELNEDMVSINESTVRIMTPDNSFREGTYVFYRNGRYYFMWSVDDTRSLDYRVGYGMSTSPLGNIEIPVDNIILKKNPSLGIYGTGHNSVLQNPITREWYIVYHRFNFPNGIHMGDNAGFNREVCIDRLFFNADGTIKPVKPTLKGIVPLH